MLTAPNTNSSGWLPKPPSHYASAHARGQPCLDTSARGCHLHFAFWHSCSWALRLTWQPGPPLTPGCGSLRLQANVRDDISKYARGEGKDCSKSLTRPAGTQDGRQSPGRSLAQRRMCACPVGRAALTQDGGQSRAGGGLRAVLSMLSLPSLRGGGGGPLSPSPRGGTVHACAVGSLGESVGGASPRGGP